MALFSFDASYLLGNVHEVDTHKVSISVETDEDLRKAQVGQLVALRMPGPIDAWLAGIIDRVTKAMGNLKASIDSEGQDEYVGDDMDSIELPKNINMVRITLVGTVKWDSFKNTYTFSRSLTQVPEIDTECYVLKDKQLENFMNVLALQGDREHSLELGRYTIDASAVAYLDGNKLFQRHAALLGSTGSGKSWSVAAILERAAQLPSANLIVFDLHGEYRNLSYASHLRIPGPEDLGVSKRELLYLPYWLLNAEEMQAMFVERSEFSAHNQVMVFQDAVIEQKKKTLIELGEQEVLAAFTLDSPIPYSIDAVIDKIAFLNEEMVQGVRGLKQGNFYGQFSRLLTRLRSKLSDKRYGFLFQAPETEHQYESMARIAAKLMDYYSERTQIKVIDFSEVPADILPVIVGLVARIVYQVQFWTDYGKRWPIAFVCDEAHLYLPKRDNQNPLERRAVETFEKIAKEGRKYGVSLLIVSQRPSDVSTTVLSQCNNVIALRLTNGDDQNTVKRLMPDSLESLLETLPILDIGEALVVGDAVLLPSRIKINPPKETPDSATIDFWTEWQMEGLAPDFAQSVENMRRQRRVAR